MREMDLVQLIAGTPVTLVGHSVRVTGVCDDSRLVTPGSLFVARGGSRTDGRKYVEDAVRRGAVAVLSNESCELPGRVAQLTTRDVGRWGLELANRFHGDPGSKLKLIGITGTNGKTTTTFLIRHFLRAMGVKCGIIGTVEIDNGRETAASELTTPGAIQLTAILAEMVRNGCGACAMEVSSHALDQGRVEGLRYRVAGFTNLTGDHLDYHKSMEAYAAAKAKLFEGLSAQDTAVINRDSDASQRMARDCKARVIQYSTVHRDADLYAGMTAITARGTHATLQTPSGQARVVVPLIGRHNVENVLLALGVVESLGGSLSSLQQAIEHCPQTPGRLERLPSASRLGFDVFVDYAHTDDALDNVLRSLRSAVQGRILVMFGCGGDRDATKRPRMAKVACELAHEVVVTSDNPRTEDPAGIIADVLSGVPAAASGRVHTEPDRARAIELVMTLAREGDVVLLAGKGHEDYQLIGTEKRPFDDRLVAERIIQAMDKPCLKGAS